MEPKTLGWQTFAKSWADKCNPKWINEYRQIIMDLIKWIIPQVRSQSSSTHRTNIMLKMISQFRTVNGICVEALQILLVDRRNQIVPHYIGHVPDGDGRRSRGKCRRLSEIPGVMDTSGDGVQHGVGRQWPAGHRI